MADIRQVCNSDFPAVIKLWKEYMDFHARLDPFFQRAEDGHQHFQTFLESVFEHPGWQLLVAVNGEQISGFGSATIYHYPPLFARRQVGYIQDLIVADPFRRQGIGHALAEEMYKWFNTQDIDRIELNLATTNNPAREFWKKLGFKPYTERWVWSESKF